MDNNELQIEREKLRHERFKAWLGLWQFILGTVVVGLITVVATHVIKSREVAIKEHESERLEIELLGKYIDHALSDNAATRERFAHYFWRLSRSKEMKEGWQIYREDVLAERKQAEGDVIKYRNLLSELQQHKRNDAQHVAELKAVKEMLRKAESQLVVNRVAPGSSRSQMIRGEALGGTGTAIGSGSATLTIGGESR